MRSGFALLVSLGAGLLPATSGADDGLSRCAKLENADERLACYDELPRAAESPSGTPVDASPSPSYLTGTWKLGAKDGGARHLADILGYRPNYIILLWTNRPNTRPRSPATGRAELEDLNKDELKFQASFKTELISRQAFDQAGVTQALGHVGIDSVRLWFGYTQKMNWQALNHSNSRPVRDTNYEPEAILTLGTGNEGDGLKLINLGFVHESNGLASPNTAAGTGFTGRVAGSGTGSRCSRASGTGSRKATTTTRISRGTWVTATSSLAIKPWAAT